MEKGLLDTISCHFLTYIRSFKQCSRGFSVRLHTQLCHFFDNSLLDLNFQQEHAD